MSEGVLSVGGDGEMKAQRQRMWRGALGVAAVMSTCALAGVACSSTVEEEEGASSDSAFSQAEVDNDATLSALQRVAADVNQYEISVKDIDVPEANASVGTQINGFSTRGLDWFKNPAVSYPNNKSWDQGTPTGKKCQWAAIFRFHAIFSDPPAEATRMLELEGGMWHGSFWSWIDDNASTNRLADPTPSYAWASSLWKWIGASGKNDTCRIPTRTMVARMMTACLEQAQDNGGDPKGCQMPEYDAEFEPAPDAGASDGGTRDGGDASNDDAAASDAGTRDGG